MILALHMLMLFCIDLVPIQFYSFSLLVRGCKYLRELYFYPQSADEQHDEAKIMPRVISYLLRHLTQLQVKYFTFYSIWYMTQNGLSLPLPPPPPSIFWFNIFSSSNIPPFTFLDTCLCCPKFTVQILLFKFWCPYEASNFAKVMKHWKPLKWVKVDRF